MERAERIKLWLSAFDLPIEGYRYPSVVSTFRMKGTKATNERTND